MKIKNVALSLAWLTAVILWLWQVGVLEAKNVGMDLTNAIQHMQKVRIIGGEGSTLMNAGSRLLWIETNNFVISKDGTSNKIINGSTLSNILWWQGNTIDGWDASTILWWESNKNDGDSSTILWWQGNHIEGGSNSTIVGGVTNIVNWDNSVIVGWTTNVVNWNNSAVLWSKSTVDWNFSVSLWNESKNNANYSFLWTDGSQGSNPLNTSNVFVINAARWMVVNANKPNSLAKLTIWWSLVIDKVVDDDGNETDVLPNCTSVYKWVLKVVSGNNGHSCFCSCDGNGYWHSLYGQWGCEGKCNSNKRMPGCAETGKSAGYKVCTDRYVWSCNEYSKPVTWEWAYFVDSQGVVHWTCQTDAWDTATCQSGTGDNSLSCS